MTAQEPTNRRGDRDRLRGVRWAGLSAVLLAAGYVIAIPIYALVGDQPSTGIEAQLTYFADHAVGWWTIVALMVVTDLLYVPVFLGLHAALRHLESGMLAVGVTLAAFLFVALDLAVTWTGYSTMIVAGSDYVAATSEAQRAALVATAAYPAAVLQSPILGTYAIVIPAIGVLLVGLVMLKGVFSRPTAYLAIAMGVVGIAYTGSLLVEGLAALRYATGILAVPFYLLVGGRLFRLSRS